MRLKRIVLISTSLVLCFLVQAQTASSYFFSAVAGLNIGAAAPLSMPREIREIKSYSPNFNPAIGGDVSFRLGQSDSSRWILTTGLHFQRQSMQTHARVKNYQTEISNNGNTISGVWTGDVITEYSAYEFSLPILVGFRLSSSWHLFAGGYMSWAVSKSFGGSVMEGYLREGNPTGGKVVFANGQEATYEFGDQLRSVHYGVEVGGQWDFAQTWFVSGALSLGLNNLFQQDFKTVSFSMHPIFFNLAIGKHFYK